jgi:type VI secretion system protein ImpH
MLAKKRRFEPPVIERLFREPWRFDYFQAVRLLERWLQRHAAPRQGPAPNLLTQLLRFENSTSLGFPASQLEAIRTEPPDLGQDAAALAAALRAGTLKSVRLTPTFMGLLGGSGVLPAHYTERMAAHGAQYKDDGPRAFFDTFSSRSLALFYEAWRKYRLVHNAQGKDGDTFLPLLLGLAGLGNPALRLRCDDPAHGGVLDASLGHMAATLRQRPVSIVQVARVLSEYFGQPLRAEQFIGAWYDVPVAQQSMLGGEHAVLGASALVGERVWQRDLRLRLVVGPLDAAGFDAFLPQGPAARALESLVALFTGVAFEYEVELVLEAAAVRPTLLADTAVNRLGWDAYLVAGPQHEDRRDVRYMLSLGTSSPSSNSPAPSQRAKEPAASFATARPA